MKFDKIANLYNNLKTRNFKDSHTKKTSMINDKLKDTNHSALKKEAPWDNEETDESDKEDP